MDQPKEPQFVAIHQVDTEILHDSNQVCLNRMTDDNSEQFYYKQIRRRTREKYGVAKGFKIQTGLTTVFT